MAGEFIILNSGLDNAVTAAYPGGVSIKLTTFKVGSGTGYTPDPDTDTDLHGIVLYTGLISGYVRQGDGSLLLTCVLPAEVGPFVFGELGIYTDTGALFAVAVLETPIDKPSSTNSGFGTTFTFNALLKVGSSPVVIETTGSPLGYPVQYVPTWSGLEPAPISGPAIYMTIVAESDSKGDFGSAIRRTDGTWSIASNYVAMPQTAMINGVAGNKSWVTIPLTAWTALVPGDTTVAKGAAATFLIKAPNHYICQANASLSGTNVQFTFTQPFIKGNLSVAQPLRLWCNYRL